MYEVLYEDAVSKDVPIVLSGLYRENNEGITSKDIMAKRLGIGISPKYTDIVIGRVLKENQPEDTIYRGI